MLCSILVGIDNTRSGVAAQRLGVRWAKRSGAVPWDWGSLMSPGFARLNRRGPWAGNQALIPCITWAMTVPCGCP